eukprot:scaffold473_cov257-Pinguiococcus_pyrenoidosus.AAC.11
MTTISKGSSTNRSRLYVSVELPVPMDAARTFQHRLGNRRMHLLVHRRVNVPAFIHSSPMHTGALLHVGEGVQGLDMLDELDNAKSVALPEGAQGQQLLDHSSFGASVRGDSGDSGGL